jgi:hypothetical protein
MARFKIVNTEASRILGELALRLFGNRCFVTHKKFQSRGFTLHHLWYVKNDVRRENYPKGEKGRDEYYRDLKKLVEKKLTESEKTEWYKAIEMARKEINKLLDNVIENPTRFMLLTNGVHTRIDHFKRGLSRMKRENFYRLVLAVILTRKDGNKE